LINSAKSTALNASMMKAARAIKYRTGADRHSIAVKRLDATATQKRAALMGFFGGGQVRRRGIY
jgi:hypothetical protein